MSILLETLKGNTTARPPVWFMRQAGRVLPNYLALREKYSFNELMRSPDLAAQVTLLPVDDLNVDAAILFSDILVIPQAMGMDLNFTNKGPVFENPIKNMDLPLKHFISKPQKLDYIYDVIDKIVETKPADIPLIGFCGAPMTVLTFMIQGLGSKSNFSDAVKFIFKEKKEVEKLIEKITDLSVYYAKKQIEHGVDLFQLFESNAGLIPNDLYFEMFASSVEKIADAVRETGTPFIFFPKGIGIGIERINRQFCDYVSVDWQIPIERARRLIDDSVGIQGNLDPRIVFADKKRIELELQKFVDFGRKHKNWIFNFGHGFLPKSPYENAKFIVNWIKQQDWN